MAIVEPKGQGYSFSTTEVSPCNFKARIVPAEWKDNLDTRLTEDLLNANRYFAHANPAISRLVEREASRSPEDFYTVLRARWAWHHEFYEEGLEPVLDQVIETSHFALSPSQIDAIATLYRVGSLIDQATLPVSAATKKHLDYWIGQESKSMTEAEKLMLLSPPVESFWVKYRKDHLDYVLALREGHSDVDDMKRRLINTYHASDEKIFEGRFQKFAIYFGWELEEIRSQIGKMTQDPNYWVEHFYSTIERPRSKAIRNIIVFDNGEEYRILMSLMGISGYVLRKRVLQYLDETKILKNSGKIYEFDDEVVLQGLARLKDYRGILLHKDVKPYRQTGPTCGAVSLMMALHQFGLCPLDRETEWAIHRRSKSETVEGNHFSGLAEIASALGLEAILIHSEKGMFKNDGMFTDEVYRTLMDEYACFLDAASASGAQSMNGVNINIELLRKYLADDYLVILGGHVGPFLHAILLVGYNDQGLVLRDPLNPSSQTYREHYVNSYMKTPIGSWALAIRKDRKGLVNVLQKVPEFSEQALKHISL